VVVVDGVWVNVVVVGIIVVVVVRGVVVTFGHVLHETGQ
jgi:hypothetical protein